ncbi:exodeoxyribonuclease VII large subunit [Fictibacillus macauensis ZFHKF-1]|uniref:Exodeoxyribonuclease 7 large subunit n=1 Tax=Fictibacillus macauensis ZFHKF-1 TaxID=1196324 RepID=I8UKB7_9BACL|nr:exodeoxyribonuclease VII large subunit [Fictibacillus macauensis]EIT87325.1 exodeoxyribonuclease VII large subunit [Fictibacillus macauensis ZFHKF-1]
MPNDRYVPISTVTRYIKRVFEEDSQLNNVWVRGELSNVKRHSRGHLYFTLKDEHSKMNAVMFAGNNRFLPFQPENGMKVLIQGEVSVYEPMGQYQLYARAMKKDGIGDLHLAYEQLKQTLQDEGLFAQERKRPIPAFPNKIAVITSPTGAAVRDILTTIKRRFPVAQVILYPVLVQGPQASRSIVAAIEQAHQLRHDVMIVGRGGGSIEELWAFNEEIVARAMAASTIPIISAVGHETDFTIADFVADLRAPTPTAAAELAVPHIDELRERLAQRTHRLQQAMKRHVDQSKRQLASLQKSYAFRYPNQLVKQKEQELDRLMEQLLKVSKQNIQQKKQQLLQLSRQLAYFSPVQKVTTLKEEQAKKVKALERAMKQRLEKAKVSFTNELAKLNALSPLAVMERGYSLVFSKEEQLVKSVQDVEVGEAVTVQLQDGTLDCHVSEIGGKKHD